ncbi:MAG: hypothetical protein V3W44_02260 [Dehalococcoidales bacterium]
MIETTKAIISDDLTLIAEGAGKYRLITLASKAGAEAIEGNTGFVDITDSEVPALVQALIKTQPCPLCAVGNTNFGPNHGGECDKYTPF